MNTDLFQNPSGRTALFWSNTGKGWKRVVASDPVDILEGDTTLSATCIQRFFQKYAGNLITGYLGYEYGVSNYYINNTHPALFDIPDVYFTAYKTFEQFDTFPFLTYNLDPGINFHSTIDKHNYLDAIDKIINHIRWGDIYQTNFTHFLRSTFDGDAFQLFRHLSKQNPVEFASFIQTPEFTIHSLSPERFATIRGRSIFTEPIKGTRPRGINRDEDVRNRAALLTSEKEKAELNMITDLLRNDFSKICETGSVKVSKNRELMPLEAVWHTHSIIEGILKENTRPIDAILSLIPGGSITGCPKKRAMEIIGELEAAKRGVYTGTIGIQYPNGDSDWSIAIRTIVEQNKELLLGVGGGITLDSNPEDEYAESLAKAKSFMEIQV